MANHHQRQINRHKLQSQSLDLQQIWNPKISTKEKRKRRKNSKSSTNTATHYSHKHCRPKTQPTTATTMTPPEAQNLNPTNQSMTQNPHIETHPKSHTHDRIKRSEGQRRGLWKSTARAVKVGGERSWARRTKREEIESDKERRNEREEKRIKW